MWALPKSKHGKTMLLRLLDGLTPNYLCAWEIAHWTVLDVSRGMEDHLQIWKPHQLQCWDFWIKVLWLWWYWLGDNMEIEGATCVDMEDSKGANLLCALLYVCKYCQVHHMMCNNASIVSDLRKSIWPIVSVLLDPSSPQCKYWQDWVNNFHYDFRQCLWRKTTPHTFGIRASYLCSLSL